MFVLAALLYLIIAVCHVAFLIVCSAILLMYVLSVLHSLHLLPVLPAVWAAILLTVPLVPALAIVLLARTV